MSRQRPSHMSSYQMRLNRANLEAHLAAATAPDARRRVQVLLYLAAGVPLTEIVGMTGYRPRSIRQIAQRYIEIGADSLVDQRAFAHFRAGKRFCGHSAAHCRVHHRQQCADQPGDQPT